MFDQHLTLVFFRGKAWFQLRVDRQELALLQGGYRQQLLPKNQISVLREKKVSDPSLGLTGFESPFVARPDLDLGYSS